MSITLLLASARDLRTKCDWTWVVWWLLKWVMRMRCGLLVVVALAVVDGKENGSKSESLRRTKGAKKK